MGEYEEFVRKIPAVERVPEPFSSIDNRLDFLGPRIIDMLHQGERIENALAALPEGVMPKKIEQIPFSRTLEKAGLAGSRAIMYEKPPFSGYIKQITPHWPDGTNALVDIRVGHGNKQFCPIEGYLALNDATPTYPFSEWVRDDEEIWVEMRNGDGGNTHAITVTVTLEGAP